MNKENNLWDNPKATLKEDLKNFLSKAETGDNINFDIDQSEMYLKLDNENTLMSYEGIVKLTYLGEGQIIARFIIEYDTKTLCARCVQLFDNKGKLNFKREYRADGESSEDVKEIIDKDFQIELGRPIIEEIMVDIPMKPICNEKCKGIK